MNTPDTYDNNRRYIFNNWSTEDFTGVWNGESTLIKAGETKEFPMFLAMHFCKHFTDREMSKAGKSTLLGIPEERNIYDTKTIAEITDGTDSPALASLKEQIRKEVEEAQTAPVVETKETPKVEETKEFGGIA